MAQHDDFWAKSAANAGYTVHENVPYIGISPDKGDGFIVPLAAPQWFAGIRDEGTRDNVFRGMAAHALRVAQSKIKAAETPTRAIATEAAASALNGGYKPSKSRDNDIVGSEAAKLFRNHVANLVKAQIADATDSQIDATVAAQVETARGKEVLAGFAKTVMETGTYSVGRKGAAKADKVSIEL